MLEAPSLVEVLRSQEKVKKKKKKKKKNLN